MNIVLLLGCAFSAFAFVTGQIQCPVTPATLNPDGSVTYSPLPPGSALLNSSYNPGVIGGWYSLASGFVDAVRPGSLPYDQILETLNATGIQCSVGTKTNCGDGTSQGFDAQGTIRSFSTWWIGLIVVTIIGGLAGCGFCVTGMCFCCCRCCGRCGGSKTQEIKDNMDCKAFTFAIILLLFILLLFVGVVLAFFSNEQTYDSLDNVQVTINDVAAVGVDYINDTINEISALVCQLASDQGVAGFVIKEAEGFNRTLVDVTNGIQADVDMILSNITVLNPGYNQTIDALESLGNSTNATIAAGNMLNTTVVSIATQVESIRTRCLMLPVTSPCNSIPPAETFTVGVDYGQLPDTSQELSDVRSALQNIDFMSDIQQGRQDFEEIRQNIESTVSDNINAGVDELLRYNVTVFDVINNITSTVQSYINNDFNISNCPGSSYFDGFSGAQLNVGYLRQCLVNRGFDTVQGYDVYRYAFGIIICSLSLVTVVLMLVGLVMGMVGFRKDCNPEERSGLSHCGGIFLVLGVETQKLQDEEESDQEMVKTTLSRKA